MQSGYFSSWFCSFLKPQTKENRRLLSRRQENFELRELDIGIAEDAETYVLSEMEKARQELVFAESEEGRGARLYEKQKDIQQDLARRAGVRLWEDFNKKSLALTRAESAYPYTGEDYEAQISAFLEAQKAYKHWLETGKSPSQASGEEKRSPSPSPCGKSPEKERQKLLGKGRNFLKIKKDYEDLLAGIKESKKELDQQRSQPSSEEKQKRSSSFFPSVKPAAEEETRLLIFAREYPKHKGRLYKWLGEQSNAPSTMDDKNAIKFLQEQSKFLDDICAQGLKKDLLILFRQYSRHKGYLHKLLKERSETLSTPGNESVIESLQEKIKFWDKMCARDEESIERARQRLQQLDAPEEQLTRSLSSSV